MLYVGLTGGIGSGKTLAGKILSAFGAPVFNADDETKKCYNSDDALRAKLTALLGDGIYHNGRLQRSAMAAAIFTDAQLLAQVNALVHPVVMERFRQFAGTQQAPYIVMEAAILFESGIGRQMHKTITVEAPEAIRIQRAMARDSTDEATVCRRMQHQWTDEQRAAAADFIVVNDGRQALLPQLQAIDQQLRITN
ncbi:MAG: dephospho-CoA kinase [Prevotellaceae bacterium]|jgi:dephospho-CoA kinase|nr:dephospho-CoA kinase [Prevotellaceae bacterium]